MSKHVEDGARLPSPSCGALNLVTYHYSDFGPANEERETGQCVESGTTTVRSRPRASRCKRAPWSTQTLIGSASIRQDGEARWAGHRSRKPVHGYKAHIATDKQGGLIRGVEVTTAN